MARFGVDAAMLASLVFVALQAAAVPAAALNPHANDLFERDSVLRDWALRKFDTNRDGWLTLYEAQPALAAFKDIADGDRDGRITTWEYARGKDFIAARW